MKKLLTVLTAIAIIAVVIYLIFFKSCNNGNQVVLKRQLYDTLNSGVQTNLNSIDFLTAPRGITVGDYGTILLTTNGGHQWDTVGTGLTTQDLFGISIVDSISAIAVGKRGKIFRSTDSTVRHWVEIDSNNIETKQNLRAVVFNTAYTGYAVGDSGVILRSTDGGNNWTKQHGNPTQDLYGISINSSSFPIAVGNKGLILRSIDYGVNWDSISSPTTVKLNSVHFYQVSFHVHLDTGFAVGNNGTIIKSTDGGASWSLNVSHTTDSLRGVFISAPHWGYAVGDFGTVVRYDGKSWTLLSRPTMRTLNAVDPSWNPTSVCVGEDGEILDVNPPAVDPDGSCYPSTLTVTFHSGEDCTWDFELHTTGLSPDPSGGGLTYNYFETCSNMEMTAFGGGAPNSGWAQNERYFARSHDIIIDNEYGSDLSPTDPDYLAPLTLTNSSGSSAGYITLYYIGSDDNPYLLGSGEINCSP